MANLISDSDKAAYEQAMHDLHDTFSREISVWHKSAIQPSISNDDNYDGFYNKGPVQPTYTSQSKVFKARIKYIDRQEKEFGLAISSFPNKIQITQTTNLVRIKVDKEAADYIRTCEKVIIDDVDYTTFTAARPHGLFTPNFFTYYLIHQP